MSFFYSAQGMMVAQPVAKPVINNIENFWQSRAQATEGTLENYAGVEPTFVINGNYKNSCYKCKAIFSSCKRDTKNSINCDFYCEGCVKNGITLDKKKDKRLYCNDPKNLKNCDKTLKTTFKILNSETSPSGIVTNTGETINYNSACGVLERANFPFVLQPDKTCKQNMSYGLSDAVQGGGQATADATADATAAKAVADAALAKATADAALAKATADAALAKATADAAVANAAAQQAATTATIATQPSTAATTVVTQPADATATIATQPAAATIATQPAAATATVATQPVVLPQVVQNVVPQVVQQFTQRFTEKFSNSISDRISDYIFRR
jgi:hypothetical protein